MKSKSLIILQRVASSLMNNNGQWLDEPIGIVKEAKTNDEGIKRLKNIIEIIINSPDISKYTKRFITTPNSSIRQVVDLIDSEERDRHTDISNDNEMYGYSYVVKILSNDCKLIMDILGYSAILDCINNNLSNCADLDARIVEFVSKHGDGCKERKNLILYIDDTKRERNEYSGSPEFFKILEKLRPYLITEKNKTEKEMTDNQEFVRYFNYLLSLAPFIDNDTVRRDRDILIKFLKGGDISLDVANIK